MKQYKNKESEISVRRLKPLTVGICASLAACLAVAVGIGLRGNNGLPVADAPDESSEWQALETFETTTGPAFSPGRISGQSICWTYYEGDDIEISSNKGLCVLCREPEDAAPYITGSGQQDFYPEEFLRTLSLTSDRNGRSSADPTDLLLVGFPLIAETDEYAVRALGYTEDGTLHINFAAYRNPNQNMTAEKWTQNAYFLLAVPENLPDFTDYSIEYTIFESNYLREPQPDDEPDTLYPAFADDPVYQAFHASILGSKYVENLPRGVAFPMFTVIAQSEQACEGDGAWFVHAEETFDDPAVPEDLREIISANTLSHNPRLDSIVLIADIPSPDAQCAFGKCSYNEGRVGTVLNMRLPDTARESKATFCTVMQFPEGSIDGLSGVSGFDLTGYSYDGKSTNIDIDEASDMLIGMYSEMPWIDVYQSSDDIAVQTAVTDSTETTPTLTKPAESDVVSPQIPLPTVEKMLEDDPYPLPEDIVLYPMDAENDYGLTTPVSGKRVVKAACSNAFLSSNLSLWIVPTQQETRQFLEYADSLNGQETDSTDFREMTGGGFQLYLAFEDGTEQEIEVCSDGYYSIAYIGYPENEDTVIKYYKCADSGIVDKLVMALQNAHVEREAEMEPVTEHIRGLYAKYEQMYSEKETVPAE